MNPARAARSNRSPRVVLIGTAPRSVRCFGGVRPSITSCHRSSSTSDGHGDLICNEAIGFLYVTRTSSKSVYSAAPAFMRWFPFTWVEAVRDDLVIPYSDALEKERRELPLTGKIK